jgi:hypothetical protein
MLFCGTNFRETGTGLLGALSDLQVSPKLLRCYLTCCACQVNRLVLGNLRQPEVP